MFPGWRSCRALSDPRDTHWSLAHTALLMGGPGCVHEVRGRATRPQAIGLFDPQTDPYTLTTPSRSARFPSACTAETHSCTFRPAPARRRDREGMGVFRSRPFSRHPGFIAACRGSISLVMNGENSLLAGKNAGNFGDSIAFCKNSSRK